MTMAAPDHVRFHDVRDPALPARGVFEVRTHPVTDPNHMRRCYGSADYALCEWYVSIEQAPHEHQGTLGAGLWHPDPYVQTYCHGTFDQVLTPVDDDARRIVAFVKSKVRKRPA